VHPHGGCCGVCASKSSIPSGSSRATFDLTGRSVILSCNGQRTMRTCLDGAAALTADDLSAGDFGGAAWAFFSAYGLYQPGLLPRAMALAKQVSCCTTMEVVAALVACLVQDHNAVAAQRSCWFNSKRRRRAQHGSWSSDLREFRGQGGAKVALDLASFEVVRAFREPLLELLAAHRPDFLICNEVRRHSGLRPKAATRCEALCSQPA
jgi:hypothetical protein